MKKMIILLVMLFAIARSQETKYAGAFLELGIGARALAMGSAFTAISNDGSGFYWNPAGTATIIHPQASAMYASLFNALENHAFASVSLPLVEKAVITASWIRLGIDDIPRFYDNDLLTPQGTRLNDPLGNGLTDPASGSFSFANNAFFISMARSDRFLVDLGWLYSEFPLDFAFGVNFKYLTLGLDDKKGTGLGIDSGIRIGFGLDDLFREESLGKFTFGLTVQDVFETKIAWDTNSRQNDVIPRNWRAGFGYLQNLDFVNSQILLAYDIDYRYDGYRRIGVEYIYKSMFAVRFGNNNGNFTAGAGISYWNLKLDYAFQKHDLGNSHRVSTTFILQ